MPHGATPVMTGYSLYGCLIHIFVCVVVCCIVGALVLAARFCGAVVVPWFAMHVGYPRDERPARFKTTSRIIDGVSFLCKSRRYVR